MGFHIGFHYAMIINMVGKMFGIKKKQRLRTISYILQKNQFAFFNYEESVVFFIIDYITIMGLMIFISYYMLKIIMKLDNGMRQRRE